MPLISVVLVSHRSGVLAVRALESFRRDAEASGLPLETIAVVNSGDPEEVRALSRAADRVIDPGRNLGFAGGLNVGVNAAAGDVFFLANADLVVRPGALGALVRAAGAPLAAAGPAFFLDEGETIHLPPAEEPHPFELARRRLGDAAAVFRRRLARGLRAAREAVQGGTREVSALSGALVAVTRRTLERAGAFDEAYALYFEENDWQRRLRALGGTLRRVGAARVIHQFNQSAHLEPRAASWFAASERRYFETHFGARGGRALDALVTAPPAGAPDAAPLADGGLLFDAPAATIALSPVADFGAFALVPRVSGGSWRPPEDVVRGFRGATWYARAVDPATGRVLAEGAFGGGS